MLEWECCLKHQEDGAREGARFIQDHIIRETDKACDDFASSRLDVDTIQSWYRGLPDRMRAVIASGGEVYMQKAQV